MDVKCLTKHRITVKEKKYVTSRQVVSVAVSKYVQSHLKFNKHFSFSQGIKKSYVIVRTASVV
jgi:hypothetical protein